MASDDLLSTLTDDLLRRILYFVPFKEAASTSVLSRRWRSLWRSSGAVNLDVRFRHNDCDIKSFFSHRDAFVRAAQATLDAADARVSRLTLRVEDPEPGGYGTTYKFLHGDSAGNWNVERDVVGSLISHPAARQLEELRVAAVRPGMDNVSFLINEEEPDSFSKVRTYSLRVGSLPLRTLRVLDLTRCKGLKPAAATDAMPRLETLRLRLCSLESGDLQALMDAAPGLATVHLESVFFKGSSAGTTVVATAPGPSVCLRCREVTDLVIEFCGMEGQGRWGSGDRGSVEIDAPKLRHFRYKGSERRFSLASPAPDMVVLELSFTPKCYHDFDKDKTRVLFWHFVRNFTSAKVLKLKVNNLKDITVGKARRAELLCTFRNAMCLELEGVHHPTATKAAAVAIANLLRCCPAVRDLRLKLSTVPSNSVKKSTYGWTFLERKDSLDYNKSIDRFLRRDRLNPVISLDDNDKQDIPGLSGHSLTCLQSSLRIVALQFHMDNSSWFGIQLVKFFTSNAKVL
ncbi:unnamed protein product [Urochloa humidicola]